MVLEPRRRLPLQLYRLQSANKTAILSVVHVFCGYFAQLGERVNNDAKNDVEQDGDHDEEKWQVEEKPDVEGLIVARDVGLWG